MYSISLVSFILLTKILGAFSVTTVKPCKPPGVVPAVFDVSDCATPPCVAKKLSNLTADITFTPDQDYEKLHVAIIGEVMGVKHPFPGKDGIEACPYLYTNPGKVKAGCPVKAGQEYVYSIALFIEKHFLKITANTHWSLKDKKSKKEIICGEFAVKIT